MKTKKVKNLCFDDFTPANFILNRKKITTILSRNSCIIIMFIVIIQINPSIHQPTYTPHSFLCINNYDIKSRYDYYLKFNISHSLSPLPLILIKKVLSHNFILAGENICYHRLNDFVL